MSMDKRVLLNLREPDPAACDRLRQAGYQVEVLPVKGRGAQELIAQMRGFPYIIDGGTRFTAQVLNGLSGSLRLLCKFGVGVDNIDVGAAGRAGIAVANTPGQNAFAVAEHALTLMLCAARGLPALDADMRTGGWAGRMSDNTLIGKTVGLIGFGNIARKLAQMLSGFPVHLLAYDPYFDQAEAERLKVHPASLDEIAREADFISLHLPLNEQTRGIVNRSFLAAVKRGAVLVNTSRGPVVNEEDVMEALRLGNLGCYATDVYSAEPLPVDHPLRRMPGTVLSPHVASNTTEAFRAILNRCVDNILEFDEGKCRNLVTPGPA